MVLLLIQTRSSAQLSGKLTANLRLFSDILFAKFVVVVYYSKV